MAKERRRIEVSEAYELAHLAKEVVASGEVVVLHHRGIDLALLSPIRPLAETRKRLGEQKEADAEAFRSSAGAWADVDTDEMLWYIYDARDRGVRHLQH